MYSQSGETAIKHDHEEKHHTRKDTSSILFCGHQLGLRTHGGSARAGRSQDYQVGCCKGTCEGLLHCPGGLEGCGQVRELCHKVQAENVPEPVFTEWRAAGQGDSSERKERSFLHWTFTESVAQG